jgi:hypothetical protein
MAERHLDVLEALEEAQERAAEASAMAQARAQSEEFWDEPFYEEEVEADSD